MRSFVTAMVLAASFALLVPDNQTLRAAESFRQSALAAQPTIAAPTASSDAAESAGTPSPEASWLLALGFLAAVISRRLGSD